MDHISKIEGAATLDIRIKDDKVDHVELKILEYKRFYTKAVEGKPIAALPQLLSRICGTCSNAHIMCSIEACERAVGIVPTPQTMLLRHLTMYGLNIRDHALHLYLFALPDMYGKDNFLDFDENDEEEHQHLHDGFEIKAAGNYLAELVAGRSVHATYPMVGGFNHFPDKAGVEEAIKKLEAARPAVLRCIKTFMDCKFFFDRKTNFMALVPSDNYGFIEGEILTSLGERIPEREFRKHLEEVVIPYSMAPGYTFSGKEYMVGALARMNVAKEFLHSETRKSARDAISRFPSTNVFDNNLAQAVEILHSLDHALEILRSTEFTPEPPVKAEMKEGVGVGVIEAPRGTLYHRVETDAKGIVRKGEVIVPTGQNQVNIEKDIGKLVESMLPITEDDKEKVTFETEKLIRAYDPCMSCASHFLTVNWDGSKG